MLDFEALGYVIYENHTGIDTGKVQYTLLCIEGDKWFIILI
jgi:hypothetical protein